MANPRLAVSFTGMAAHPNASRPRFAPRAFLFAGLALLLLSACGESPEAHELRVLREANASLRQQLISSEEALAQARAELAARPTVAPVADPAQPVPSHEDSSSAPETTTAITPADSTVEDTTYIVVSKHHVPGRLSPQPTGADPSAARRIPPVYQVTFRGEQSSRVYPPLDVAELAYPRFREGQSYTRADLNASKPAGSPTRPATTTIGGGNSAGPPIDFDSIFGSN